MRSAFDNEIEVASGSDAEEDALCLSFAFSLTLCFPTWLREWQLQLVPSLFLVFLLSEEDMLPNQEILNKLQRNQWACQNFEFRPMETVGVKG